MLQLLICTIETGGALSISENTTATTRDVWPENKHETSMANLPTRAYPAGLMKAPSGSCGKKPNPSGKAALMISPKILPIVAPITSSGA